MLFSILALIATYFIIKGFFALLFWAAPFLIALALFINWKAVADTANGLARYSLRNPLPAIMVAALAYVGVYHTGNPLVDTLGDGMIRVGIPLLSLYILLRSVGYSRMQEFQRMMGTPQEAPPQEEEFAEYEELESRPGNAAPPQEEPLEPPDLPETDPGKHNSYDQFFK